jgi:hypothetical protein
MSPGVCHTRCNGARPFLAAASARRLPHSTLNFPSGSAATLR